MYDKTVHLNEWQMAENGKSKIGHKISRTGPLSFKLKN